LDDDGYALVGALQNTSAMETFLLRAALHNLTLREITVVMSGQFNLTETAYWAWNLDPIGLKFSQVLRDVQAALNKTHFRHTSAATTTVFAQPLQTQEKSPMIFRKFLAKEVKTSSHATLHVSFILCATILGVTLGYLLLVAFRWRHVPESASYRALQFGRTAEETMVSSAPVARALLPEHKKQRCTQITYDR